MSDALHPDVLLHNALRQGRYVQANKALLKGASFLDMTADGLLELWSVALTQGVKHLVWMKDHAGIPDHPMVWSTLLGRSWVRDQTEVANTLLAWGADPNGLTEGGATPFAYALRSSDPIFEWAMAHTDRGLGHMRRGGHHPPFRILFSSQYGLTRHTQIHGVDFPTPERLDAVIQAKIPTGEDPFHPLLSRAGLGSDAFLMAWRRLCEAGFSVEAPSRLNDPTSPTNAEAARTHRLHGGVVLAWEASLSRAQTLTQRPVAPDRPRRRC